MGKLLLGLLQPQSGEITLFGSSPAEKSHIIGYVPQYSHYDRAFPITVEDVVLMGRLGRSHFYYSKEDKSIAAGALAQVGLSDLKTRPFSDLSGGQRQRVLIARALATQPDVLLLDEPTASIDQQSQEELYDLLLTLNKSMTIILISHDLEFVSANIEKVICFDRKVAIHPTGEIAQDSCNHYGIQRRRVNHSTVLEEIHE